MTPALTQSIIAAQYAYDMNLGTAMGKLQRARNKDDVLAAVMQAQAQADALLGMLSTTINLCTADVAGYVHEPVEGF